MKSTRKPFLTDSRITTHMKPYESILDPHLAGFYGNPVVRRTMVRGGVITKEGEVIRREYNPKVPVLHLPPVRCVPVTRKTISPQHIRLLKVTSSRHFPKFQRQLSLETHVKPMKHEEYEEIIARYCLPTST